MRPGKWFLPFSLVAIFILTLSACGGTNIDPPDGDGSDGDLDQSDGDVPDGDLPGDGDGSDGDIDDKPDGDDTDGDNDADEEPLPDCEFRCVSVVELLDFGPVMPGAPETKTFEIESSGLSPVTIINVGIATGETSPEYSITGFSPSEPEIELAPRQKLLVEVTYTPVDLEEDRGKIIIATNADVQKRYDVALTMGYKGAATLAVTPADEIAWGERPANNQSYPEIYTIACSPDQPDSNRPLEIQNLTLGLGENSPFELRTEGGCEPPFFLANGANRACYIVFKPTEVGEFTDTLTILASDGLNPDQTIVLDLSATGVLGDLNANPISISYNYVLVGQGKVFEFVDVSNDGTGDLTIAAATWLDNSGSVFSIRDDNGFFEADLESGASKTFAIVYEPTTTGVHTGTLAIASNDPNSPQEIAVTGIAVDECPPATAPDPQNAARCIPSCEPGERICNYTVEGWGWNECLDANGTLGDFTACLEGQVCIDGVCQDVPCYPGERRCFDTETEQVCGPNGWAEKTTCTTEKICKISECREATQACREYNAEAETECDDENACTTGDACDGFGNCTGDYEECDDENPCTQDFCDQQVGCVFDPRPYEGDECDDENPCTSGDHCDDGECTPTTVTIDCDDHNPCTTDFCDPEDGCSWEYNTDSCDDENICTTNDQCDGFGNCLGGDALDCADDNDCTRDTCSGPTTGCQHFFQSGYCDDGDPCTRGDVCGTNVQGQPICLPGSTIDCSDDNPCTADTCDEEGNCINPHVVNGTTCTDNSVCTGVGDGATPDQCIDGVCVPGSDRDCADTNICTTDYCDPASGCLHVANTVACDDGNICTIGDQCQNRYCRPGTQILNCADDTICTIDSCDPDVEGGCVHRPTSNSVTCDADNNVCTTGDHCQDGVCIAGTGTPNCADTNPCTIDSCDPIEGCQNDPQQGLECDDGDPCTVGDSCNSNGTCLSGQGEKDCNDDDDCTRDSCVKNVGCSNQPFSGDPGSCSDNDACTVGDYCNNGTCQSGGGAPNCNDYNDCTIDACDPVLGCTHTPRTGSCDDGDPCTLGDVCVPSGDSAICQPGTTPLDCNDDNDCTTDSCIEGSGCSNAPRHGMPCSDGNACTLNDTCEYSTCKSGPLDSCDDDNDCTADSCDTVTGCNNAPITGPAGAPRCSDLNLCTDGDHCVAGVCVGNALECNDSNPCTDDMCAIEQGGCYWPNNTNACDADGSGCTMDDTCSGGTCYAGSEPDCSNEDDECNVGICDSTGTNSYTCIKDPDPKHGNLCDADGNGCTVHDSCNNGNCQAGAPADCSGVEDQCNASVCLSTSSMEFVCNRDSAPYEGDSCNDGNECTTSSQCQSGSCVGTGNAEDGLPCTDDNDPCTDDVCDAGSCTHPADDSVWQTPGDCPGHSDMVKVLCTNRCIDKYEMSICDGCGGECKGRNEDDYWFCFGGATGGATALDFFCTATSPRACSLGGVEPSRWMTFNQGKKACENAGKYMCPPGVWYSACSFSGSQVYPYGDSYQSNTCNGEDYGNTHGGQDVRNTGALPACTNAMLHYDMSGNAFEWTDTGDYSDTKQPIYGGSAYSGSDRLQCGGMIDRTWNDTAGWIGSRCCITSGP